VAPEHKVTWGNGGSKTSIISKLGKPNEVKVFTASDSANFLSGITPSHCRTIQQGTEVNVWAYMVSPSGHYQIFLTNNNLVCLRWVSSNVLFTNIATYNKR